MTKLPSALSDPSSRMTSVHVTSTSASSVGQFSSAKPSRTAAGRISWLICQLLYQSRGQSTYSLTVYIVRAQSYTVLCRVSVELEPRDSVAIYGI